MKISGASAERSAYESIRAALFTEIHRRPMRRSRDDLEEEVKAALCQEKVPGFAWAGRWGLLEELMEGAAYTKLATKVYVEEVEPSAFDPAITVATNDIQMRMKTAVWDQKRESFYIWQGTLEGICEIIRDALNEPYHKQLKRKTISCKKVKVCDYFIHLNRKWYKLDTGTIKKMKAALYEPWNLVDHITDFGIRLKNDQEHLLLNKIKISDEEMTQFYIEQMLDSGMFEKLELKE